MRSWTAVAGAAALFAQAAVAQMDPIVIKGSKFFYQNSGAQFFMQGIAYQQEYSTNGSSTSTTELYNDPLANADRCQVDVPLLRELNTNTIRVYAVDPTKDHTVCMQLLQEAGIYIVADLSQPGVSINRDAPAWNDELYERYTSVVDMFSQYDNVIGFFAGNEVSNNRSNTDASAFVKAAVRDTKAYIRSRNYRQMYVGYATNDDAEIREDMANFFNCGNPDESIDFWGYNIYSWCGDSSFTESGFDQRVAEFAGYSVPSFFAEYGCNTVQPRVFTEVGSLFGPDMTGVFSGGILYMYFQEANDYGLVTVQEGTTELEILPDFTAYSSQMAQIAPTGVDFNAYTPTNTPAACPDVRDGEWEASADPLPPVVSVELCRCMYNSLSCVVSGTTDEEDFGQLFGTVCGYGDSCAGIAAFPANGTYGAYSVCNATEQLSFAFNQYYTSQNSAADACDFGGAAAIVSGANPSGTCSDLIDAAGTAGTNTIAATGGGASSTGNSNAAGAIAIPRVGTTFFSVAACMFVAGFFGAGMILL